jgi:carboxypeptidase A1
MSRRITLCLIVVIAVIGAPALADDGDGPVRYDNHKVVRVQVSFWDQVREIHGLGAMLLSDGEGPGQVDYLFPPDAMAGLEALGIPYQVLNENIQKDIDAEWERLSSAPKVNPRDPAWFADYKALDQVVLKLQTMVADHPELASLIDIGDSIEGRDMWALRVTGPGGGDKPAVLFDGTQHAREWIAVMVPMWIADRLVYEYYTNSTIKSLMDRVEFFIVPVVNPDGYAYTWTTGHRLWRKNRRDNPGTTCDGVDLNRNWGVGWGGEGASNNPCDETYYGTAPFSEPETQALSNFFLAHQEIVSTIDYHNYSQLIMSPYGYTSALPVDHPTFMQLNQGMHDKILAVHGKQYNYGPIYTTIYPASGGSVDWCYDGSGVFAFTIELRDTGQYGFELPPDQIIPTCQENFEAAMYLAEWSVTAPLSIRFPEGLPAWVLPNTPQAVITRILGSLDLGSPRLYWRVGDSGPFDPQPMVLLGNREFEGRLPGVPCGRTLEYYFAASRWDGATLYSPANAPASWYSAESVQMETVFADDMEVDRGWTVGAPDDNATSGIWNRMDPEGTAAQPEDDHTPPPGTICWVTDGRAGGSLGAYDVDNGKTTLFSPVFDGSQGQTLVSYWRWYSNDKGSAPNADVFRIDISNNSGGTWTSVEVVGPAGPEASGGWYYHEFKVADIITPTATMKMRFVAADEGAGSIVEAAVDDFLVMARVDCPYPPGDLNCDGQVNFGDINPFVLALTNPAGYQAAFPDCDIMNGDINGDGEVNFGDINPFVALLTG